MEIIKKRKELREKFIKEASRWVAKLSLKATAFLIGSYARGDFNLWSDVDILLISDEFKGGPINRLKILDIPAGFQVIPLTSKEFKKLLARRENLVIEVAKNGIVLKDDLNLVRILTLKKSYSACR